MMHHTFLAHGFFQSIQNFLEKHNARTALHAIGQITVF